MGRPRKARVRRDRRGVSRGESEEEAQSVVLAFRARRLAEVGLEPSLAKDARAGHTLGRLRLIGLAAKRVDRPDVRAISEDQYQAGMTWAEICRRHSRITDTRAPVKSPSFVMVSHGMGVEPEPSEEEIGRIRDRFRLCFDAIQGAGRSTGLGWALASIAYDVCVLDRAMETLTDRDYGNLRFALNALSRALR